MNETTATAKVTEDQKRSVACPKCNRAKGRACVSSHRPGANTVGGGWGGAPDLEVAHAARRTAYLAAATKGPKVTRVDDESTGDCPDGCGFAAYAYTVEGLEGYVDAAPGCVAQIAADAVERTS